MQATWSEQAHRQPQKPHFRRKPQRKRSFSNSPQFSFFFKASAKSLLSISIFIHIESSTNCHFKKNSLLDSLSKRDCGEFGNGLFWRQQVRDAFQTLTLKKCNKIIFSKCNECAMTRFCDFMFDIHSRMRLKNHDDGRWESLCQSWWLTTNYASLWLKTFLKLKSNFRLNYHAMVVMN